VKAGRFDAAVAKCAKEWASLPGSPYGQPVKTLDQARARATKLPEVPMRKLLPVIAIGAAAAIVAGCALWRRMKNADRRPRRTCPRSSRRRAHPIAPPGSDYWNADSYYRFASKSATFRTRAT